LAIPLYNGHWLKPPVRPLICNLIFLNNVILPVVGLGLGVARQD